MVSGSASFFNALSAVVLHLLAITASWQFLSSCSIRMQQSWRLPLHRAVCNLI
jgi:hypothetical protein